MFRKKVSRVLAMLEARLGGLRAIKPDLDLGGGVSVKAMAAVGAKLSAAIRDYNQALAEADQRRDELLQLEVEGRDLAERSLAAVASRFGRDSVEYGLAGGVRTSDRKRPRSHKPAPATPPAAPAAPTSASDSKTGGGGGPSGS